jgi:hypothetical protein
MLCRGSVVRHAIFDPWNDGFGGSARLVGAGRDCADVASAGCVVVAVFEAPPVMARLNDIAVMGQAIEQRGCHLGVAEHTGPFSECEVGGDDDGGALIEPANATGKSTPSASRHSGSISG